MLVLEIFTDDTEVRGGKPSIDSLFAFFERYERSLIGGFPPQLYREYFLSFVFNSLGRR
jgi:hypothetical protein